MKTEDILNGIWAAEDGHELQAHLDLFQAALDKEECSYDLNTWGDIELAIIEVIANDFQRVIH